jgi:hypothetical protein
VVLRILPAHVLFHGSQDKGHWSRLSGRGAIRVERIGVIGHQTRLYSADQLAFTVEDEGVFTTTWSATVTYRPGFNWLGAAEWPERVGRGDLRGHGETAERRGLAQRQ